MKISPPFLKGGRQLQLSGGLKKFSRYKSPHCAFGAVTPFVKGVIFLQLPVYLWGRQLELSGGLKISSPHLHFQKQIGLLYFAQFLYFKFSLNDAVV